MKKTLIALAALLLAGCASSAYRAHVEMARAACDNGQPSACIELQDAYAQRRQAQAMMFAYSMAHSRY